MTKIKDYPSIADENIVDSAQIIIRDAENQVTCKGTFAQIKAKIIAAISLASDTVSGISKLYNNVTGNNTDGAPDQNSVKNALSAKADLVAGKVPSAQIPETHFKGKYISLSALQAAVPTSQDGDYAIVDAGIGSNAQNYIWDAQAGWVASGSGGGVSSFNGRTGAVTSQNGDYTTAQVTQASDKLYTSQDEKDAWNAKIEAPNIGNKDNGTNTVNIDGSSGVATFTQSIPEGGAAVSLRIVNSSIRSNTMMYFPGGLKYSNAGNGVPMIANYITSDGLVDIAVINLDTVNETNDRIVIPFVVGEETA